MNCWSLNKHHGDIISDNLLMKSDIIILQETWLNDDTNKDDLQIPGYLLHLNSNGHGKGIATYFKKETFRKENIKMVKDIKQNDMQLSMFTSSFIDIVAIYRSQSGDLKELQENIDNMIIGEKPELLLGDFNFCYQNSSSNQISRYLLQNNFEQLVQEPTHLGGNTIDHVHIRDIEGVNIYSIELHSKYYTDHKALAITISRGNVYSDLTFVMLLIFT